jgi:hypothetical protein
LVAFEGEQIVGLVFDDPVGDRNLAAHGIDGHQRSLELIGFGQVVEKPRGSGDFIGFLGHAELSQDQSGIARIGTQRMEGFEPLAHVVGAARGLTVDGDQIVPVGPERRNPAFETASEQHRSDAIDQRPQPASARDAEMKRREPQKIQMMLAPCDDVVEIVTPGDGGAGQKQKDLGEGIYDPPRLPAIVDLREML